MNSSNYMNRFALHALVALAGLAAGCQQPVYARSAPSAATVAGLQVAASAAVHLSTIVRVVKVAKHAAGKTVKRIAKRT